MLDDLLLKHADLWSIRFVGFQCEEPWAPLIDKTLVELRRIAPEARVTTVKEKAGRLVIYVEDKADQRVRELLRGVEILTAPPGEALP